MGREEESLLEGYGAPAREQGSRGAGEESQATASMSGPDCPACLHVCRGLHASLHLCTCQGCRLLKTARPPVVPGWRGGRVSLAGEQPWLTQPLPTSCPSVPPSPGVRNPQQQVGRCVWGGGRRVIVHVYVNVCVCVCVCVCVRVCTCVYVCGYGEGVGWEGVGVGGGGK